MGDKTTEVDFVSVGGGLAGLAAAVAAADLGLSALIVEKSDRFGGVTAYSNGQLWAPGNSHQLAAGLEDTPEDGATYLRRLGMGFADERLLQAFVDGAASAIDHFTGLLGIRWRLVRGLPDYYYPDFPGSRPEGRYLESEPYHGGDLGDARGLLRESPHVPFRLRHDEIWALGGGGRSHDWDRSLLTEREARDALTMGPGLAAWFLAGAVAADVPLWSGTLVERLVLEEGRVAGVEVTTPTGARRVRARRGVLLATGGYDWDPHAMAAFEGHLGIESAAPPSVTGDHLVLAGAVGARTVQFPKPLRLGYRIPGRWDDGKAMTGIFRMPAYPHAMLVNRRGRRFCDESFYPSIGHAIKAIDGRSQEFVNWPCWMVFDQQFRSTYSFGSIGPDDPLPPEWDCVVADTIPDLARAIGVDVDGLVDQVERFNRAVDAGVDPEFHRGERPWSRRSYGDSAAADHPNLGTILKPPFHAMSPLFVGTGIPTLGLETDEDARVVGGTGRPIPGLYAAGNSSAIPETGAGYQSGVANARALVFGLASARDAAARTEVLE